MRRFTRNIDRGFGPLQGLLLAISICTPAWLAWSIFLQHLTASGI